MTAKRFKRLSSSIDYYYCIDSQNENKGLTEEDMLNKLNELHEENQDLKTGTYTNVKNTIKELKEIGDYQAMRIKELTEENERLSKDRQLAETEVMRIRQTLNESIEIERTQIGQNALKQFKERIQ